MLPKVGNSIWKYYTGNQSSATEGESPYDMVTPSKPRDVHTMTYFLLRDYNECTAQKGTTFEPLGIHSMQWHRAFEFFL